MAVSKRLRLVMYERDGFRCQYCGLQFDPAVTWDQLGFLPMIPGEDPYLFLEADHIHPLKHGGTDALENLRSACSACNRSKGATTRWVDWPERLRIARELLAAGPDDQKKAEQAAAILLGYRSRSELPRPRFLFRGELSDA